ncbi:MAG: glycosyltransferase family 4 protein [Cytophagales bacterium]|nr:glycosyltransferase family 4 protein [Cytophagales bacterium]
MKIALVTELYPPSTGGQEIRFKELAEEFTMQGHQVLVFTIGHKNTLPPTESINGVQINRIIFDDTYIQSGVKGRKNSTIIKFTFALKPHLDANFDLVIFNQWPLLPSILSSFLISTKKTITCVDFVEFRSGSIYSFINYLIFRTTHKIACISNSVANKVKNSLPNSQGKRVFIIPSLVRVDNFNSKEKTNYLFTGRMEKHKHPEDAIMTVLSFNSQFPTKARKLHLIGDGGLLPELKQKYKDHPEIVFHGFVSEEEKHEIISKARALIFPSEREGLPKSVIECMVAGVPTLTTNYVDNGTKDFVTQENIGVVADPNIQSLANGLLELESKYSLYESKCLENRRNFDVSEGAKNYLKYLN